MTGDGPGDALPPVLSSPDSHDYRPTGTHRRHPEDVDRSNRPERPRPESHLTGFTHAYPGVTGGRRGEPDPFGSDPPRPSR
jgi:hypothetical protein